MKLRQHIATLSIGLLLPILSPTIATAQRQNPCPSIPTAAPASKTREIHIKQHGIKFNIPSNYKTRRYNQNNQIEVLVANPSGLEYVDCLTRNQVGTEPVLISSTNITIGAANGRTNLVNIADNIQTNNRSEPIRNVQHTEIAGQKAIKYEIFSLGEPVPVFLLLTPNKESFIQISYRPSDSNNIANSEDLANMIIKSLKL
jgi:hypothetical protein